MNILDFIKNECVTKEVNGKTIVYRKNFYKPKVGTRGYDGYPSTELIIKEDDAVSLISYEIKNNPEDVIDEVLSKIKI